MTKKLTQDPVQPGESIVQGETASGPAHATATASVVACRSLASYFHERIDHARQNQGLEATDETSYYVISLLDSFAKADLLYGVDEDGNRRDEALALLMARAMSSNPGDKINHFRRLGDTSLFISGFFSDSLRRRPVGVSYYVAMGQGAYASLSTMLVRRGNKAAKVYRDLYGELSSTFASWVEVLREVSETANMSTPTAEEDTSELYVRWQRACAQSNEARARQLAGEMLRRGMWPST